MRYIVALLSVFLVSSVWASPKNVQKTNGLIPGLYQLKTGQKTKGWIIAAVQIGTVGTGIYLKSSDDSDQWFRRYRNTTDSLQADRLFQKVNDAKDRGKLGKQLLWGAGIVYVVNLLDVALYDPNLDVTLSPMGTPIIQAKIRFK